MSASTESYPTVTRRQPATYEDLLALPQEQRGELIDGELIAMSRPRGRHLKLSSVLGGLLLSSFHPDIAAAPRKNQSTRRITDHARLQGAIPMTKYSSAAAALILAVLPITAHANEEPQTNGSPRSDTTFSVGEIVVTAGVATLTTSTLTASIHGITAAFTGTDPYMDSSSPIFIQGVNKADVGVGLVSSLGEGVEVLPIASPIVAAKAKKNAVEMAAMKRALGRADGVVAEAQRWLQAQVVAGVRVSEVDFAREVERLFLAAGAVGLSFKVISASGLNGAVVHHPPSDSAFIEEGQLMLLDTGCYFEEGYATDLTRTFFVGAPGCAPSAAQKQLFTRVLKAAIAGMSARIPKNAVGAQLDGITRAPLWRDGLDYAHGTGHGVGINVHEAPPSVSKQATTGFEEGQVFSIEPGLYLEGVGGVRIENLCTVAADGAQKDWLRVVPLTFSPLDARLIDDAMLDAGERAFLDAYTAQGAAATNTEGA